MRKRGIGCVFGVLLLATAICGDTDDKHDRKPKGSNGTGATDQRTVDLGQRLGAELAAVKKKAPAMTPTTWEDHNLRYVAEGLVSKETYFTLLDNTRKRNSESTYADLNAPPSSLRYRDCHDAASVYSLAADLAKGERKELYCHASIAYYRQYMRLAAARTRAWGILKKKNSPNRDPKLKLLLSDRDLDSSTFFELCPGIYCMTLWYHGGHYYESVLVGKSGRVQQGSVELAAPWLAQARPPCRNTHSAEAFLKQLLRTIPYSSKVIRSVQDIPPPWHREPHSEESRKKRAEAWNKFRSGPGRTICPPTRVKKGDLIEYEIYTYERLGGCVRRYTICFKNGKFVSIKDQECARGAGNAWYIM